MKIRRENYKVDINKADVIWLYFAGMSLTDEDDNCARSD